MWPMSFHHKNTTKLSIHWRFSVYGPFASRMHGHRYFQNCPKSGIDFCEKIPRAVEHPCTERENPPYRITDESLTSCQVTQTLQSMIYPYTTQS